MAATVGITFTGDPSGAVNASKAVQNSLGGFKSATGDVENTTGKAASGMRQHWGAISLAAGGALLAIGRGAKSAGDAASDLGEQVNKTRVVFRGSEGDILSWSQTTAKGLGISRREALEATGVFGNILVPMGFARKRAGEMSKGTGRALNAIRSGGADSPGEFEAHSGRGSSADSISTRGGRVGNCCHLRTARITKS